MMVTVGSHEMAITIEHAEHNLAHLDTTHKIEQTQFFEVFAEMK